MGHRWKIASAMLTLVAAAVVVCTVHAAEQLSPADDQGRYVYLIEFAEPGLLEQHRQQRGSAAGFEFHAPQMAAAREALQAQQARHLGDMSKIVRRTLQPSHYYLVSHSGVAVRLTPEESRQLRALPGIARIERERVYELDTYRGPEFIGADAIWAGTGSPDGQPHLGAGLVAAILDTGIHLDDHPSFVNDPSCGHGDTLPDKLLSAVDCGSTDASGMCNGANPQDWQNHGSHVAGTVAGNVVTTAASPPPAIPAPFDEISGVAPCASIRSYMVCPTTCPGGNVQAGMDSVLIHGDVDVMNYSISGGLNPWLDNDRRKLDLVDAGIFVAASAGNTGETQPNPVGQVNHRGPWVMSVAASTHDAIIANDVSLDGGPTDMAGLQGTGPAITSDFTGQLRFAGDVDPGNVEGCAAFAAGSFAGEAALIARGTCAFADKVNNAVSAGADFVIVYNNAAGPPIVMGGLEATSVPSVMVDDVAGAALIAALDGGTEEVTVSAAAQGFVMPDYGDILAGFSFRGPTPSPLHNLQKPNITAPGVNIYAAGRSGVEYTFISGTSMSGPHAAGAGLLVVQANPDWTPTEAKSAMQMTASKPGTKDTGVDDWDWDDVGSGRVDLSAAALAGLVMDETFANFLAANPAQGGDVRTLNLPSVREMDCSPNCTWTRTVRNTLDTPSNWTVSGAGITADMDIEVSPSTFSFTGDISETQELTITVAPTEDLSGTIGFGEIVFSEDAAQSPELHFTVAISGEPGEIGPEIETDPNDFVFVMNPDATSSQTLTISNVGIEPLEWMIETEEVATMAAGLRGFVGDFDIANWELVNNPAGVAGSFNTNDGPPIELFVIGGNAGVGGDTDFQIEVPATGTIHFDWGYQSIDTGCWDSGGYAINGAYTELACNDSPVPYFDASESVSVSEGDLFAFRVWTDDGNFGAGELGVTNFEFEPGVCTDPATLPWLSVSPDSGTTAVDASDMVDVNVDTTGLAEGTYEAHLCIASNDPNNAMVALPVSVTVIDGTIEPPTIEATPLSFSFDLISGESDDDILTISNLGDEPLNWVVDTAVAGAGLAAHDPALDEALAIPDFTVISPANGGSPQVFTIPAGIDSSGAVVGFSFEGTVAGVSGTGSWASDMCMIVEAPDGTIYGVGGISGTQANCSVNSWDFQGGGSTEDGFYESSHDDVFDPATGDAGDWTFTFVNDWSSTSAADMNWSDVTVTLHKFVEATGCDAPANIPWLSVDPASGTTLGGSSSEVTVSVDTDGLASGDYEALLCVNSNDPANPLVEIPVEMSVSADAEIEVDPTSISMTLPSGDSDTETLTISNLGDLDLVWNIDTAEVSAGHRVLAPFATGQSVAGADSSADIAGLIGGSLPGLPMGGSSRGVMVVDCDNEPGIVIQDDGTVENGYSANPATITEARFVDRFTPEEYPAQLTGVCVGFLTISGTTTFDIDIVAYDDSGAGGTPGAELGSMAVTVDVDQLSPPVPPDHPPVWTSIDLSAMGVVVSSGSVYVGVRFTPQDPNYFVASDQSTDRPVGYAGGHWWLSSTQVWEPIQNGYPDYRALMVRPVLTVMGGCASPSTVPWLSVDPDAGTTAGGDFSEVEVTLDATGLAFGTYEALLCINSNDPDTPVVPVPVTLEVPPGENDAFLEGTVSSLGYCSDNPAPAAGATIEVEGDLGGTFVTTADASGFYSLVIDEGESPVTVTASAPDHASDAVSGVVLVGQQTTVVDFDLVLEAGCATIDPEEITDSVGASDLANYTLTIGNLDGAAALNWSIDLEAGENGAAIPPGIIAYHHGLAGADGLSPVTGFDRAAGGVDSDRGDNPHLVMPGIQGAPIDTDLEEGFDDITTLPGGGWSLQNQSEPLGISDWFQGNPTVFVAHEGPDDSYIGANFNNTTGGTGIISNWLITPEVVLSNGTELRFWTRTSPGSDWPDRLEVRLSTSGDSVDVGSGANDVGDFDTLLVSINENQSVGGYPESWTEFVLEVEGLSEPTSGRFGLRYHVTSAGPDGSNSNYIGIDTLSITQPVSTACSNPEGVAWLSVVPDSGSVAAGAESDVTVTVDGSQLAEGTNEAHICVTTDDAQASLIAVPVTIERLDVLMATVEGTVSSLGYCGADPSDAAGAGILIQGQTQTWTATTDTNGFFQVNVPADEGPVDVMASAVDHLPATAAGVELVAGETATVDMDLVLEAACATVMPASVDFVLQADATAVESLVIGNVDGATALTWWLGSGDGCFDGSDAWLSLDVVADKVAAGATQTVTLTADSSGLAEGVHETALCIETTDDEQPLMTVPVILQVQEVGIFHDRFEVVD